MDKNLTPSRREALAVGGLALLGADEAKADEPASKIYRIGVISATIRGKPQKFNGHTWHFAQYFHPTVNADAIKKYIPYAVDMFRKYLRNPAASFDQLPFPDTKITHYYDADPAIATLYTEAFPGVQAARKVEDMVKEVDAIWLGDASGFGDDHFDLAAPGLERGLPTFCDKPIGETVEGTRKILKLARDRKAPLMSSSLFRHQWGTEQALRMRDSKDYGPILYAIASQASAYSLERWQVYGQHPVWMLMTLLGPGVDAVSMYAREGACHGLMTYADRMPGEFWYGRPDVGGTYCSTSVSFQKQTYTYTPAIEGDYWLGHHYQMFRMANTFRTMVRTRAEPVPHGEILEVTAVIHAAIKSLAEKSRLVPLAEVMG